MSLAENLKRIRKDKNLSQEEFAEQFDVSRQAVSKWEQGLGYPEVEKLMEISKKMNISIDALMSNETKSTNNHSGRITINSPHENVIVTCDKVLTSSKMKGGKDSPKYALFCADNTNSSFFGESTFLGWYENEEAISKEIEEIYQMISQGISTYTLKYSVKTKRNFLSVKIIKD